MIARFIYLIILKQILFVRIRYNLYVYMVFLFPKLNETCTYIHISNIHIPNIHPYIYIYKLLAKHECWRNSMHSWVPSQWPWIPFQFLCVRTPAALSPPSFSPFCCSIGNNPALNLSFSPLLVVALPPSLPNNGKNSFVPPDVSEISFSSYTWKKNPSVLPSHNCAL